MIQCNNPLYAIQKSRGQESIQSEVSQREIFEGPSIQGLSSGTQQTLGFKEQRKNEGVPSKVLRGTKGRSSAVSGHARQAERNQEKILAKTPRQSSQDVWWEMQLLWGGQSIIHGIRSCEEGWKRAQKENREKCYEGLQRGRKGIQSREISNTLPQLQQGQRTKLWDMSSLGGVQ